MAACATDPAAFRAALGDGNGRAVVLPDAAGADVATGDLEFDAHFRTRSYVVAVDGLDAAAAPFVVRVADEFANHADAQVTMR